MAKCFTTWTVLPHDPVEKLNDNLWRVEGTMPDGKTKRVMAVAKRQDGALVIHNGIALEEPVMAELEAFGAPTYLIVPNGYHRQDAATWKQRYPAIKVLAPRAHMKRVAKIVPVDGPLSSYPDDANVKVLDLDGCGEGALEVHAAEGVSYVFNDAINNLPKMGGVMGFLLAPTGTASVPRIARILMVKDKARFRQQLERMASNDRLRRVIVSHGKMISEGAGEVLRAVAARL